MWERGRGRARPDAFCQHECPSLGVHFGIRGVSAHTSSRERVLLGEGDHERLGDGFCEHGPPIFQLGMFTILESQQDLPRPSHLVATPPSLSAHTQPVSSCLCLCLCLCLCPESTCTRARCSSPPPSSSPWRCSPSATPTGRRACSRARASSPSRLRTRSWAICRGSCPSSGSAPASSTRSTACRTSRRPAASPSRSPSRRSAAA